MWDATAVVVSGQALSVRTTIIEYVEDQYIRVSHDPSANVLSYSLTDDLVSTTQPGASTPQHPEGYIYNVNDVKTYPLTVASDNGTHVTSDDDIYVIGNGFQTLENDD